MIRKILFAGAVAVAAVLVVPAVGYATGGKYAERGQACPTVGEVKANRQGVLYVCEQRTGDVCPVWHAKEPVKGHHPPAPCTTCPSSGASASASTSASASASASASTPASASASSSARPSGSAGTGGAPSTSTSAGTVPVGNDTLPVTGSPVLWLVAFGTLLVVVGGLVLWVRRRDEVVA